jgi:two-component system nitrogen regulation response regulator GlnG
MSTTTAKRVLIVDDEEAVCWALSRALARTGLEVATASTAEEGLQLAADRKPDAVVLDVRLPGMSGLTALNRLRQSTPETPVIMVTAYGDLATAVRSVEEGAFDYLPKPFDLAQALDAIQRALNRPASAAPTESEPDAVLRPDDLIGNSPAMQSVFKRIALVAPRDACVLITGESGTGKELVARAVHRYSRRRERLFLPIHIAALNPSVVESELFGHVKGAFTGAADNRQGLLAVGSGGTVFLDELGEIPPTVQVKLLRVLEQRELLPVGGTRAQAIDVRLVAATHRDLAKMTAAGEFRQDLYFRLNVFQISLPPLRERLEDLPLLASHHLRRIEPGALPVSAATLSFLSSQPWPGNIRELFNALEHAVIVARGEPLAPEHFPAAAARASIDSPFNVDEEVDRVVRRWATERLPGKAADGELHAEIIRCMERALLDEALKKARGNRWLAARWLGLNRATVRKKLEAYDLAQAHRGEDEEPNGGEV